MAQYKPEDFEKLVAAFEDAGTHFNSIIKEMSAGLREYTGTAEKNKKNVPGGSDMSAEQTEKTAKATEKYNQIMKEIEASTKSAIKDVKAESGIKADIRKKIFEADQATRKKDLRDLVKQKVITEDSRAAALAQMETSSKKVEAVQSKKDILIDAFQNKISGLADSLGPAGKAIFKMSGGAEALAGASTVGEVLGAGAATAGAAVLVMFLQQLGSVLSKGADNASLFAYSGGIMNDALTKSIELQPLLTGWLVDSADATASATGILKNYGMMTTQMGLHVEEGTGIIRYNSTVQKDMYADLYRTSVFLAKMGPMFGMSTDEVGEAMGKLLARFHTNMRDAAPGFEAMARVAMSLGIQTSQFADVLTKAGDQMRWFNRAGLDPMMHRFSLLGTQMLQLAAAGDKFWKGMGSGEIIDLFEKLSDFWASIPVPTALALTPGAGATSLAGGAEAIQKFYETDPVTGMRQAIEQMTSKMSSTMTQQQKFLWLSTTGPFAGFGKSFPALAEALTSMSDQQLKAVSGGDMNAFLAYAKKQFPDQADNLETIRNSQLITGDPLKNIQKAVIKIMNIIISWANLGIIGSVVPMLAKGMASDLPPWQTQSPGTAAVDRTTLKIK